MTKISDKVDKKCKTDQILISEDTESNEHIATGDNLLLKHAEGLHLKGWSTAIAVQASS